MKYSKEEFKEMLMIANKEPYSPFALFMLTNNGYKFVNSKGFVVDKWEVFGSENLYTRVKKHD